LGLDELDRQAINAYREISHSAREVPFGLADPVKVLTKLQMGIYETRVADPIVIEAQRWPHTLALLQFWSEKGCSTRGICTGTGGPQECQAGPGDLPLGHRQSQRPTGGVHRHRRLDSRSSGGTGGPHERAGSSHSLPRVRDLELVPPMQWLMAEHGSQGSNFSTNSSFASQLALCFPLYLVYLSRA
jgi:hypothetical protein